jgi:hypothetical protein
LKCKQDDLKVHPNDRKVNREVGRKPEKDQLKCKQDDLKVHPNDRKVNREVGRKPEKQQDGYLP